MKPIDSQSDDELARQVQRAAALPDAPAELVQAAIALFPAVRRAKLGEVAQSALRLVRAVLTFDSAARPVLSMGMRSAGDATRHLLYSAAGRDIDLRLTAAASGYAISGQILGPDEVGIIELIADGAAAPKPIITALDDLGEFRLDAVPRGTYRLTLCMGGDRIELPPIEVGA
jgi:hypothetical protein